MDESPGHQLSPRGDKVWSSSNSGSKKPSLNFESRPGSHDLKKELVSFSPKFEAVTSSSNNHSFLLSRSEKSKGPILKK